MNTEQPAGEPETVENVLQSISDAQEALAKLIPEISDPETLRFVRDKSLEFRDRLIRIQQQNQNTE
jgi:hypothetical protein